MSYESSLHRFDVPATILHGGGCRTGTLCHIAHVTGCNSLIPWLEDLNVALYREAW